MNVTWDISQNELAAKQALIDALLTDKEQFRAQAAVALRRLNRSERKQLQKIETDTISAYDVLVAWKSGLNPLRKQLEAKRTDKTFRTVMTKQLSLAVGEVNGKVQQLIDTRLDEVERAFLQQYYERDTKVYNSARELLRRPESELTELLTHLTAATLAQTVADEQGVTIYDEHAGFWRRAGSRIRIRRERKRDARARKERLAYIIRRQQELTNAHGGLLSAISEKGWDLVMVIALRHQYEKRVKAMAPKDAKSAVKRLAIFEKITQQFRNDYIEATTLNTPSAGLEFARTLTNDVDNLLLRIFDLSTVQKNQLLVDSKEYRELETERQSLTSTLS